MAFLTPINLRDTVCVTIIVRGRWPAVMNRELDQTGEIGETAKKIRLIVGRELIPERLKFGGGGGPPPVRSKRYTMVSCRDGFRVISGPVVEKRWPRFDCLEATHT